ncbi:MAG: SGNH/GDSL hydrolase family protein, partial [Ilumatobacteraceae bacterium]
MNERHLRNLMVAAVLTALAGTACGGDSGSELPTGPLGTVGGVRALVQPPTSPPDFDQDLSSSPTVGGKALTVGEAAEGPRLLMIGDSLFAAMSSRYNDRACATLIPQGWQLSVEAEVGRFIDLGIKVVNRKLSQGFDAAVLMLGTNYRDDQAEYRAALVEILDQLSALPVMILTVTEHRYEITEVNDVIIEQVGQRDNLWLIDWRRLSKKPG